MPFVILPTNSASGGYNVTNSLRFNSGSSDYLNRTFGTATNRKIFTLSVWVKRSKLGVAQNIFGNGTGTNTDGLGVIDITSADKFRISGTPDYAVDEYSVLTTQVLRDTSAWYHLMIVFDSTQATSSNRIKMYVNGSQVTALDTAIYPSLNLDPKITLNNSHMISRRVNSATDYFDGYMSEYYFIDGQALTPTSFGETDEDTGIWKPKAYTGTYGTNGFYLQFKNSASLGTDSSGNGNNFTVNNLTSIDQTTDTPTNNFCTGNPLFPFVTTAPTYSNGNLTIVGAAGYNVYTNGTFMVSKGKWYFETTSTDKDVSIGVKVPTKNGAFNTSGDGYYGFYNYNGNKITDGVFSASQSAGASNDILQLALDMDNNKLWIGRNGTYFASGNPSAGTGEFLSSLPTELVPSLQNYNNTTNINFGSPPYAANSFADGAGYGNFSYAVPSGYYALNTKNLATFG